MKSLSHAFIPLVLLTGGIFAGRGVFSGETGKVSTDASTVSARSRTARLPPENRPEARHDSESLRARLREWSESAGGLRGELERLDVPALKKILLEQMAAGGEDGGEQERQARSNVISAVIHELYRREGPAAIEWIDRIENEKVRRNALRIVLMEAVRDHPDTALPWITKLRSETAENGPMEEIFTRLAFAGAAGRGVDEMIRVHGLFGENLRGDPLGSVGFPVGFDYEKLHLALSGKIDMAGVFTQWAVRDKEAAWQGVRRDLDSRGQPGGRYFGSLVLGAVAEQGEKEGLEWAVARLAELSPEQRQLCLPNLDHLGKLTTEGISTIAAALPPDDRKAFALSMIDSRGEEKAFVALDALSREELLETLHEGAQRNSAALNSPETNSSVAKIRRIYEEAERRYSLTAEEIRSIRPASATAPP